MRARTILGAVDAWRRRGSSAVKMLQVVALRSMAQAVNIGTGLVTAAMLGAGGRGELAALTTAPGFLAGFASLGLHAALIYRMKSLPDEERSYLGNGMILTFLSGSVMAAIGWVMLPLWLTQYSPHAMAVGRFLCLSTPFTVAVWTMMGAAEARGWFGFANGTLYIQSVAVFILLLVLWWLGRLTPETAAFAYISPTVPVFLYFTAQTIRLARPDFRPNLRRMGKLIHYGTRLSGAELLGTFSVYADQVLVIAVLPPATVGAYVVALSASRLLVVIQSSAVAVLFPNVAARDPEHVVSAVTDCFRVVFLVTGVAAAILAASGPMLLTTIYGHSFAGAIVPFQLLLAASLMNNGSGVLAQAYAACDRPGLVTCGELLGLLLSIGLMLIFVPRFGTTGASASMLAAATVRLLAFGLGLRFFLHVPAARLLPSAADLVELRRAARRLSGIGHPIGEQKLEPVP